MIEAAVPCHKSGVNGRVFIKHSRFLIQLDSTGIKLMVPALFGKKLLVITALYDCSFFKYDDLRSVPYRT